MKKNYFARLFAAVVFIAALAAILLSWQSLQRTPKLLAQLNRKQEDFNRLSTLKEQYAHDATALKAFEQLEQQRPRSLPDLISSTLPKRKIEIHPRTETVLFDSWIQKSIDVTLDDAPLTELASFLHLAAQQRPPWRVAELTLTASDRQDGQGRVNLLMETIERKQP